MPLYNYLTPYLKAINNSNISLYKNTFNNKN